MEGGEAGNRRTVDWWSPPRAAGFLATAGTVAAFFLAVPATAATPSCKPSTTKVAGGVHRVLCGATTSVRVNGTRTVLRNGRCDLYPAYVTVQIGAIARGSSYLGLVLGKSPAATETDPSVTKDGTYGQGLIVISTPKASDVLLNEEGAKFVLERSRRAGTFSATDPASKRFNRPEIQVVGSFSCGGG